MDSVINQIMDVGKKLVGLYLDTHQLHTTATLLPTGHHLVFAKVRDDDRVNACIYDFKVSSEPLLVFGPNTYDQRCAGYDANRWAPIVVMAEVQFEVARQLSDLIGVFGKGKRLSENTDKEMSRKE